MAAGDRYGIRYEEALSLEAALQRRERKRDREEFEAFKKEMMAVFAILDNTGAQSIKTKITEIK